MKILKTLVTQIVVAAAAVAAVVTALKLA